MTVHNYEQVWLLHSDIMTEYLDLNVHILSVLSSPWELQLSQRGFLYDKVPVISEQ